MNATSQQGARLTEAKNIYLEFLGRGNLCLGIFLCEMVALPQSGCSHMHVYLKKCKLVSESGF